MNPVLKKKDDIKEDFGRSILNELLVDKNKPGPLNVWVKILFTSAKVKRVQNCNE